MKFLILLPYFNRPNLVRFAINSVLSQSHTNWQLAICDDGSDVSAQQVLSSMGIGDSRISIKRIDYRPGEKESLGSRSGLMLNECMSESNSNIALVLCDDDGLYPEYLSNLNEFYKNNESCFYSYGHVSIYDPEQFIGLDSLPENNFNIVLNRTDNLNASYNVDASQVSWRLDEFTRGIFPYPQTANLDAVVFQKLFEAYGVCVFNNIVAQYKGWFDDQLGNRIMRGDNGGPRIR